MVVAVVVIVSALGCAKSEAQSEEEVSIGSRYARTKDHTRKVKMIQLFLMYSGLDPGYVDGVMGAGTREAVKEFQTSRGLPLSGFISKRTLRELERAIGDDCPTSVWDVQFALREAGFDPGIIDGGIGDKTRKRIEEFQMDNGLKVTRTINPDTWSELKKYLKTAKSAVPK
ncbi:MAG: peptidoglycan-binding protein [Elusimicrobiota bacterium]